MTVDPLFEQARELFLEECAKIDRYTDETMRLSIRDAFAALMAGDTAKRDRICRAAETLPERARAAKLEIGLLIGERLGMDRDALEELIARIRSIQ